MPAAAVNFPGLSLFIDAEDYDDTCCSQQPNLFGLNHDR